MNFLCVPGVLCGERYCTTKAESISFAFLFESGYIQPAMTKEELIERLNRLRPYLIRLRPYLMRDGRLRSGWRIVLYLLASLATLLTIEKGFTWLITSLWLSRGITQEGIALIIADFYTKPFNYPDVAIGFFILRALIALGLIWIFRKWIDQRRFLDLGFHVTHDSLREFGAGFGFVMIAWCAIFLLSLAFRGANLVGFAWDASDFLTLVGALLVGLIFNVLVGVVEESDTRGYILQNLAEGIQLIPAIAVSSLYFGLLHLLNPGAGWLSTIGIFFSGILLAMGYYVTRQLWFSIGMHAAWNFAEGPVFGFRVSGLDMGGLFQLKIAGPEWLMGGAFGPEAGALAVIVEIVMIGMLVYLTQRDAGKMLPARINAYLRSILKWVSKLNAS